jgi:hypothetical protein
VKQGSATTSRMGSTKTEPRSNAVNPGAVNHMGNMLGNHVTDQGRVPGASTTLYEGRGLEAPMVGQTNYKGGSQGRR